MPTTRIARSDVVLLVDADGDTRRMYSEFFRHHGFDVVPVSTRRDALDAAPGADAIVTEILLPSEVEGLALVEAIDRPSFQLMIDFYHLASEKEDPAIVRRAAPRLVHLHMANPQGRVYPRAWEEYDYAPFFASLRAIGYDKRISVEASAKDFATEAPQAISLLRHAFEGALR